MITRRLLAAVGGVVAKKQKTYLACDWPACPSEDATHFHILIGDKQESTVDIDLCPAHAKEPLDVVIGWRHPRGASTSRARILAAKPAEKRKP
jgi:hypothetical protein